VLLQLLNNQHANEQRLVRIAYPEAYENTCNIEENTGQVSTAVKIAFPMSDRTIACLLRQALVFLFLDQRGDKSKIAQHSLSDLTLATSYCPLLTDPGGEGGCPLHGG